MNKNFSALTLVQIMRRFPDAETARVYLEKMRWPDGVVCPHCTATGAYTLTARPTSKKPGRKGLYKCADRDCRKQFTVMVGSIFSDSHIPLDKWLIAIYLMCSSKKGISAHQIHRMLHLSYKAAWFMCHRIRYAMAEGPFTEKLSGNVEADETYIGGKRRGRRGPQHGKRVVMCVIQRGGRVRSFHMGRVTSENLRNVLKNNVDSSARLMTDENPAYIAPGKEFASHETVNHFREEYVRGDVTTNTAEGYFGLLKRGINGTFHHVGANHLHRYLAEFDFRYNARKTDDGTRTDMAIIGFEGKRLMYKD